MTTRRLRKEKPWFVYKTPKKPETSPEEDDVVQDKKMAGALKAMGAPAGLLKALGGA